MTLLCTAAAADVIQLKNGRRIVADSSREVNGRVEYTIGDNTFAIPKSLVEKIDPGPPPSVPGNQPAVSAAEDVPKVREQVEPAQDLVARVIHADHVDTTALKVIEDEGIPEKSAVANFIAANFEEKRNHLTEAARYLEIALIFAPNHAVLLEHYVSVLLQLGRAAQAVSYAEKATRSSPESADAFALLGYAYYKTDHIREAIAAWKKSLAIRPDDQIQQLLERVQRESKAEADFREQQSSHFTLRYEGSQTPDALRSQILAVLEEQYNTLQNDLGAALRSSISVSLYTDQAFFDVTQAPAWSAALNDGKIRVPTSGLNGVTPALARVLRHELTHSFIAQITHGHVPQWLNEGIAQLEEPRSTAPVGVRLAALYSSGHQIPLNQLEDSFQTYSPDEASVAYAEALAATECIRANHGMNDLAALLRQLGEGKSMESALRSTIHDGYAQFEAEIADYLKHNYGQ
jgi:tetratricopeptide (TPR) repeat protein